MNSKYDWNLKEIFKDREEFDKTNQIYFNELQEELGEDFEHYSSIFERIGDRPRFF